MPSGGRRPHGTLLNSGPQAGFATRAQAGTAAYAVPLWALARRASVWVLMAAFGAIQVCRAGATFSQSAQRLDTPSPVPSLNTRTKPNAPAQHRTDNEKEYAT